MSPWRNAVGVSASASNKGHGATRSGRSASASSGDASSRRSQPSVAMRGTGWREPEPGFAGERRRSEERVAVRARAAGRCRRASPTSPRAARRDGRGTADGASTRSAPSPVGTSHSPTSRSNTAPCPPSSRCADGGVVDRRGHQVERARLPHPDRDAADVAGLAHDPVVARVDVLQHVALVVDHDALEAGTRPRVGEPHGRTARCARDQRVDRLGHRPRDHCAPVPPVPAQNWPRSTMTCCGAAPHPASAPPCATTAQAPPPPWTMTVTAANWAPGLAARFTARPRRIRRRQTARRDVGALRGAVHRRVDRGADRPRCRRRTVPVVRSCSSVSTWWWVRRWSPARWSTWATARWWWRPTTWSWPAGAVSGWVSSSRIARAANTPGDDEHRGDDQGEDPAPRHRASLAAATTRAAEPIRRGREEVVRERATFRASAPTPTSPPASPPISSSPTRSPTRPTSSRWGASGPPIWWWRPSPTSRRSPKPTVRWKR